MHRRITFALGASALAVATLVPAVSAAPGSSPVVGGVYAETNDAAGNSILIWDRHADGSLTPDGSVPTYGLGTGGIAGLGDQGAVTLSDDGHWLYAVNAGSNDVSAFRVDGKGGLTFVDIETSWGIMPVSVTAHGDAVYVVNAGGTGNIAGLHSSGDGGLRPILGSRQPLSDAGSGPAQISFTHNGHALVVTEKNTNLIDVFPVGKGDVAGPATFVPSAGAVPFGFTLTNNDTLIVSEAGPGSASSYPNHPRRRRNPAQRRRGGRPGGGLLVRRDRQRSLRVHDQCAQQQRVRVLGRRRRFHRPPRPDRRYGHDGRRPDRRGNRREVPLRPGQRRDRRVLDLQRGRLAHPDR